MYAIDRQTPVFCVECPEYVRIEKAYDDPIGCIHGCEGASSLRKDRPVDCPIIDMEDDLK